MNLIESFRKWSAYRRTVRELEMLGDRELTDLGISRGDIVSLARAHVYRG
ncbi:MAG: DUF1127 domain-containing protein [Cucumibacter sp.]